MAENENQLTKADLFHLYLHGSIRIPSAFPASQQMSVNSNVGLKEPAGAITVTTSEDDENGKSQVVSTHTALLQDVVGIFVPNNDTVRDLDDGKWLLGPELNDLKTVIAFAHDKRGAIYISEDANVIVRLTKLGIKKFGNLCLPENGQKAIDGIDEGLFAIELKLNAIEIIPLSCCKP